MADTFSILDLNIKERDPDGIAPFYQDLNLTQIIDRLAKRWGRKVKDYYRYLPETKEEVDYRRAVFSDIKKDAVYEALMKYTERLSEVDELRREKEKVSNPMQRAVWQMREVGAYCSVYEELERALSESELSSEGMKSFLAKLREILKSGGYLKIKDEAAKLLEDIRALRFIITYEKDRISVSLGEVGGDGAYEEMLKGRSGKETERLQNPFRIDPRVSELEAACLEILSKKKPEFFKNLKRNAELSKDYERPVLKRFEDEVLFYLSFATLERDMESAGFRFVTPSIDDYKPMEAKGLYDLALALAFIPSGKKVIPNDFYYEEGDAFLVLTGPNQGGKTTFARSLGQLVYFERIGLDVPAASANVPFYKNLQTHFSVEESVETGRGKLMEELVRLAPMMADRQSGTFVIINELFTTAASYDAVIMGKKVLEHFIALGCKGIYVTHLKELSSDLNGVVSMRAMLNEERVQTFEIKRSEAEDTPCAENQVNKYRLTYEQLKERL